MKRTPFRRSMAMRQRRAVEAEPEVRPWAAALSAGAKPVHRGTYSGGTSGLVVVKENASQHSGYQDAVRGLGYCMRCRRACRPQFCHRDQGKGTGIKTDCREGWPGCDECHYIVGTSGQYPKEERRALELVLGWRTRQAVKAAGTWPARLPMWNEINEGEKA